MNNEHTLNDTIESLEAQLDAMYLKLADRSTTTLAERLEIVEQGKHIIDLFHAACEAKRNSAK